MAPLYANTWDGTSNGLVTLQRLDQDAWTGSRVQRARQNPHLPQPDRASGGIQTELGQFHPRPQRNVTDQRCQPRIIACLHAANERHQRADTLR